MTVREILQHLIDGKKLTTSLVKGVKYIYMDEEGNIWFDDGRQVHTDYLRIIEWEIYEEKPKRWRAEKGQTYFYVSSYPVAEEATEDNMKTDLLLWGVGNYFKTKEEAEKVSEAIRRFWKEYRGE